MKFNKLWIVEAAAAVLITVCAVALMTLFTGALA